MDWIKCSERMPENEPNAESGNSYLTFIPNKRPPKFEVLSYYKGAWLKNHIYPEQIGIVTHWMPLPPSPKEK